MASDLRRAAHGAGVTVDHVANPLIATAGSLIGASRKVAASKSFKVPMTLWSTTVGFSGTGKTSGIDVTKRALSLIQRNKKSAIAELRRQHEARAEAAKALQKKWKEDVEDSVREGRPAPATR